MAKRITVLCTHHKAKEEKETETKYSRIEYLHQVLVATDAATSSAMQFAILLLSCQ